MEERVVGITSSATIYKNSYGNFVTWDEQSHTFGLENQNLFIYLFIYLLSYAKMSSSVVPEDS